MNKGQMYSLQSRTRKEAASNVAEPGISHESVKMDDKQDKAAQHGEPQHVVASSRQGRNRQLRQRLWKLPLARNQHERAERW